MKKYTAAEDRYENMQYRRCGKSGLKLPLISLGLWHNFGHVDDFETGILLAYCYPERIACARPGNNAQFQMANGQLAAAGHRDDLASEPWLSVCPTTNKLVSGYSLKTPISLSSVV